MSVQSKSKLLRRVDTNLRAFYIFNSDYGKKEGMEENKILYYYPDDIQLNTKMNDIGLSEAIIAFIGNFTDENDCKALHTQKTSQIFLQAEKGFWLVIVLNVPKEIRTKDGVETEDYRAGEVLDKIYSSVLKQSYNLYRLFNGTFVSALQSEHEHGKISKLRDSLNEFYNAYIQKLNLPIGHFSEITRTVQYLPLEKSLFLRAHNLINIIKASFEIVKETMLLIEDEVVCSGDIEPQDVYSIHEYIVGSLIGQLKPSSMAQSSSGNSNTPSTEDSQNGCFVNCDKKYIHLKLKSNDLKKYIFRIYNISNATLCLVLECSNDEERCLNEFYKEFQPFISSQLSCLTRDIDGIPQTSVNKMPISPTTSIPKNIDSTPKFLFINEQNLKHITNIPKKRNSSKINANGLTTNILNLIADLKSDRNETNPDNDSLNSLCFEEIQIKTTNDFWIVKRRCNWREYFVIIFNSKSTLLDITQESKRIFERELKDAVFFEK